MAAEATSSSGYSAAALAAAACSSLALGALVGYRLGQASRRGPSAAKPRMWRRSGSDSDESTPGAPLRSLKGCSAVCCSTAWAPARTVALSALRMLTSAAQLACLSTVQCAPLPPPNPCLPAPHPTLCAAATPRSVSRTDSARGGNGLYLALLVRADMPMSRQDLAEQVGSEWRFGLGCCLLDC